MPSTSRSGERGRRVLSRGSQQQPQRDAAHDALRERRPVGQIERDCLVADFAAGLRVTLPLEEAAVRLRSIADRDAVAAVERTLAQPASDRPGSWTQRIKQSKAKLATGLATDLAEIVRDGARSAAGTGHSAVS